MTEPGDVRADAAAPGGLPAGAAAPDGLPAGAALAALHEATQAIAEVLDLDRVLQLIVDRVRGLVDADYAALGIVDAHGRIEQFITSGMSRTQRERIGDLPQGRGLLSLIIRERRSYRIGDIAAHADSSGFPPNHPPMTTFLGLPVSVRGRPVGNLYLTDKASGAEFNEADELLVGMFAAHAAIAIENARLYDQVQRLAIVDERDRIGRDLHDGIVQGLYAIALSLEDVPELMVSEPADATARVDRAIDALNGSIRDLRRFVRGLHAEVLDGVALDEALAAIADEVRFTSLVEVDVDIAAAARGMDLAPEVRGEVIQVAREAMSNVVRHARASRASLALERAGDRLRLTVTDDGRGFDPAARIGPGHRGLANLRERAAALDAELEVASRPGAGTRIILAVPIHRATGDASSADAE
jgi:signal transduction histidine kinase